MKTFGNTGLRVSEMFLGAMGFNDERTARALVDQYAEWRDWTPFAGIQVPYNVLNRDVERELIPMASALGLSVTAWGPLGHGALAKDDASQAVVEVAKGRAHTGAGRARVVADQGRAPDRRRRLAGTARRQHVHCGPLGGARRPARRRRAVRQGFPADFIDECEASTWVFGNEPVSTRN